MNFPTKKKLWQSYWLLKQQRLKKIPDFSRMNAGWIDMVPLISPLRSVPLITEASFGKPRRSIQRINRKNMVESWKILWVWFVFKSGKLKSVRFQKKITLSIRFIGEGPSWKPPKFRNLVWCCHSAPTPQGPFTTWTKKSCFLPNKGSSKDSDKIQRVVDLTCLSESKNPIKLNSFGVQKKIRRSPDHFWPVFVPPRFWEIFIYENHWCRWFICIFSKVRLPEMITAPDRKRRALFATAAIKLGGQVTQFRKTTSDEGVRPSLGKNHPPFKAFTPMIGCQNKV